MENKQISDKKTKKNKGGRPAIEITDKLLKEAETSWFTRHDAETKLH